MAESGDQVEREIAMARTYFAKDNTVAAMAHLERALKVRDNPTWRSFLGYCIARERGQFRKGLELCKSSLREEEENPAHYLNMGKIYLLSGEKMEAIKLFREGLSRGPSEEIERALREIGARKPPPIPFLSRNNPLNKYLGLLLSKIGLR